MTMRILGLTGLAGSGKSTIAREFVTVHAAVPVSLASYFKVPAVALEGVRREEVFGPEPKSDATRTLLQRRGTEEGRQGPHGEEVWIRHLDADLYRLERYGVRLVVLDDVRFPNEAAYVTGRGGLLVRLVRDGSGLTGEAGAHPSEAGIPFLPVHANIDNNRPANDVRRVIAAVLFDDRFTQRGLIGG